VLCNLIQGAGHRIAEEQPLPTFDRVSASVCGRIIAGLAFWPSVNIPIKSHIYDYANMYQLRVRQRLINQQLVFPKDDTLRQSSVLMAF
jgi:hypothetical protein